MPWNEPGSNNQDPWRNRRPQGGPPDLDEAIRQMMKKINGLFGAKPPQNTGNGGQSGGGVLMLAILAIFVAIWWTMGWYTVNEKERAVVLRFGKHLSTETAGLHWYAPLIETKHVIDVSSVQQQTVRGRMLTEDENLIDVALGVQYKIADPVAYAFNVRDADQTLIQVAESALRLVVGKTKIDDIMTGGKDVVRSKTEEVLGQILEPYNTGLMITEVTLQDTRPPEPVVAAFDDVTKAREDKDRSVKEAEGYRNKETPLAEAEAQRILQDAEAYRTQVVAQATGEVQRFQKLLPQYLAAPDVTRNRLYIETMEQVLGNVSKVMIDVKPGNMLYLPLDKMSPRRDVPLTMVNENAGK